jgi:hypothetical protein
MLGIATPSAPDVCFICGLSEEEHKRLETFELIEGSGPTSSKPSSSRRRRPVLRTV